MKEKKPPISSVMGIFLSDEVPYERRILNLVLFFSAAAAAWGLLARVIERMPLINIMAMFIVFVSVIGLILVSARWPESAPAVTNMVVFSLSLGFFPFLYFTNGGPDSGMAVYFTLALILDFLLLKGRMRVIAVMLTTAVMV
ncbi:MAG: hypothetical protein FWE85_05860, partial [Clostridiales bacterium]|nr:hypothetical protein [Clostridiales bacterium]